MSNIFTEERIARKLQALKACDFANSFLNDALNGIRSTELTIIGARTGTGKTELGATIAMANARKGKRVCLFALEAEKYEIIRRLKFNVLAQEFFSSREKYPPGIKLNFADWLHDKYPELEELESSIDRRMPLEIDNLLVYTPGIAEFTKKDFSMVYKEVADDCDLIILDHIHYLSPSEKESEYDHIKKTMWTLRDLINKHEVPVVAMSHLRKEFRGDRSLVPSLDEIHGSSEIVKQANHVIGVAPIYKLPMRAPAGESFKTPMGTTIFKVLKTRTGHPSATYAGVMKFNLDSKTYESRYVPYKTDQFCTELFHIGVSDFEHWMGSAREAAT